jgi:VWFA-related protein
MKNFSFTALLLILFSASVFAQTPTPMPEADEDVVKISTSLIQIDVTVTDKKGNIVTDLAPEDFEIYENGKKQDITNFSYINFAAGKQKPEETAKTAGKVSIPVPPSARLKPEQVRRTYALVVDDLGLSFASSYWVKQSLKKFVNDQMQEGDLVAILRVGGGIGALQSFTSDKRQLLAAVEKVRWNGQSRIGAFSYPDIRPDMAQELLGRKLNSDGSAYNLPGAAQNKQQQIQAETARQSNLTFGTLGALNYIIQGMQELPGRKSLMLFSEGFQIFDRSSKTPQSTRILDELRILADKANRASVVIHTLDPRGLDAKKFNDNDFDAADDVRAKTDSGAADAALRTSLLKDSGDTLRYLANETGGTTYIDQNDLNNGMQKVLNDLSGFYLIGYQPDSETFDPNKSKFNKLIVKLKRPDLKVRYRSGFFGVTDEKIKQAQTPQQNFAAALTSPFGANDVNVDLYSIFYNDHQNRSYVRSFVHIDAKDLTFSLNQKGLYEAKFDIIAMIFDTNGKSAGNGINSHAMQFTREQFSRIQDKGVIYDLSVPIIKTGGYQFRVALRDAASGKVGSASQFVEVPDLDKKKLTLSNLILKSYPVAEWKKIAAGQSSLNTSGNTVLLDTVSRRFKQDTVFTYSFIIYNAKSDAAQKTRLELQTRLFHQGKMILENEPLPIDTANQTDLQRISTLNAMTIGKDLQPGDYVLQLVVYDKLAKADKQIAVQTVDFEIVK